MPQQAELPQLEEFIEVMENASEKIQQWFDVDKAIQEAV